MMQFAFDWRVCELEYNFQHSFFLRYHFFCKICLTVKIERRLRFTHLTS